MFRRSTYGVADQARCKKSGSSFFVMEQLIFRNGTVLIPVNYLSGPWRPGVSQICHEMSEGIMSYEFDGLDATEKAGIERALNRCRHLAAQIESELRNKRPQHFVDKLSLARSEERRVGKECR